MRFDYLVHLLTKTVLEAPPPSYLIGIRRFGATPLDVEEQLDELAALADTFGAPVVGREVAVLKAPTASHLLNQGKVNSIKTAALANNAKVIIVDDELTPSQQRNWEETTGLAVIDRCEVILGIFADRARTKEATLQVALARAQYSLPRLKRQWTHLERQRGGGSFRGGAGELQLEVDRRLLRVQIERLKRELKHVTTVRETQRERRLLVPVPSIALVGYTNAGKSTLFNALTDSQVYAQDKLFATLDPTTHSFFLENKQKAVLTDTVGFINKLPTMLIEAFKSTLEEAKLASLLLHVVDASHKNAIEQRRASEKILEDLKIKNKKTILVLNKVDKVRDTAIIPLLAEGYENVVVTSAKTRTGLDVLQHMIMKMCGEIYSIRRYRIPPDRHEMIALVNKFGLIEEEEYDDDAYYVVKAGVPQRFEYKLTPFLI